MIEPASVDRLRQIMPGQDFDAEQALLKERLAVMGLKIPTLFKQYADGAKREAFAFWLQY